MIDKEINLYDIEIDNSKKYFKYKKEIAILSSLILTFGTGLFLYKSINKAEKDIVVSQNTDTTGNTQSQDEIIEEKTEENVSYYIEENIYDEKYKRYVDNEFNFYCAIPAHYTVGESIGGGNRITLASPNNDTHIFIGATKNEFNLSAKDVMNQYIADFGDAVSYKASGDNWYVVSKNVDGTDYYRKCFVDDTIRWFEFSIKSSSSEPIGEYLEYIENNFKNL